jgi:hypothetical protein
MGKMPPEEFVMDRVPVESSMLRSIGYDADAKILEVEFVNGSVYRYFDVPPAAHERLMNAKSHGSHFNANIRGAFVYEEVRRSSR